MARDVEQPRYTKYEIARMVGSRALQLAMGAPFMVKLSDEELAKLGYNPIKIAQLELEKGVLPITVKRPLPRTRAPQEEEAKAA